MQRRTFLIAAASSALPSACGRPAKAATIEVYKTPTCECCARWIEHVRDHGYTVNAHNVMDLGLVKRKYRIPSRLGSCHTALVEGYFVEGHVPAEIVDALLAERPGIDGIALPGMPSGSPGMPGRKDREWRIYALAKGEVTVYKTV